MWPPRVHPRRSLGACVNVSTLDAARQRLTDAIALWQALKDARQYDASFGAAEVAAFAEAHTAARDYVEAARSLT